jgi:uncharacterized membrane protein
MRLIPGWHPLIVHFPLALIVTAAGLLTWVRLAPRQRHAPTLATVASWNLGLGAIAVVFALGSGLAAVIDLQMALTARQAVSLHFKSAVLTAVLVFSAALWRCVGTDQDSRPSWLFMILLWTATLSLVVTGYRGGQNVYRYAVGVEQSSAQEKTP